MESEDLAKLLDIARGIKNHQTVKQSEKALSEYKKPNLIMGILQILNECVQANNLEDMQICALVLKNNLRYFYQAEVANVFKDETKSIQILEFLLNLIKTVDNSSIVIHLAQSLAYSIRASKTEPEAIVNVLISVHKSKFPTNLAGLKQYGTILEAILEMIYIIQFESLFSLNNLRTIWESLSLSIGGKESIEMKAE